MDNLQGTRSSPRDDTSGPHQTSSAQDDSGSDDQRPLPGSLAARNSTPTMVDASTQVPERDRIKEECEDKKESKTEVKTEIKEEIRSLREARWPPNSIMRQAYGLAPRICLIWAKNT